MPWAVAPRPVACPFAERNGLAFIGGYGHQPNIDAAHFLVDAIMPEVCASNPQIPCVLAGRHMPESVVRRRSDRVHPIGAVEDLTDVFGRVRLTVAPLAWGAGIKGKVLESLAAGVPCVCSPIAAEGIGLPGALRDDVAASPAAIARRVLALHADQQANLCSGQAGLSFIGDFASESRVDAGLSIVAGLPGPGDAARRAPAPVPA